MLDIWMLLLLGACCGTIALLIHWCQKQVETNRKEIVFMMYVLGGIVLLMGGYLVYALVHPEKF